MSKAKLEYIWLDGSKPTQGLRAKTKVVKDFGGTLEECPIWCFDGSSGRILRLSAKARRHPAGPRSDGCFLGDDGSLECGWFHP